MLFNSTKALAVLAFAATIASVAATPATDKIARRGDDKKAAGYMDDKDVAFKHDSHHNKHNKSYADQLKKHQKEVEKQLKITKEAAEKNKAAGDKYGKVRRQWGLGIAR